MNASHQENEHFATSWKDRVSAERLAFLTQAIFGKTLLPDFEEETGMEPYRVDEITRPSIPQRGISSPDFFEIAARAPHETIIALPSAPDEVSEMFYDSLGRPVQEEAVDEFVFDDQVYPFRGNRPMRDTMTNAMNAYRFQGEPEIPKRNIQVPYGFQAGRVLVSSVTVAPSWSTAEKELRENKTKLRTAGMIGGGAVATILSVIAHAAWVGVFTVAADPMVIQIDNRGFDNESNLQKNINIINANAVLGAKLTAGALLERSTAQWLNKVLQKKHTNINPPENLINQLSFAVLLANQNMQLISSLPVYHGEWDLAAAATNAYLSGVSHRGDINVLDENTEEHLLANLEAYL